jgi:hypothetical protein
MRRNIVDYEILTGRTTEDLSTTVMGSLGDGWEPFGSMVAINNRTYLIVCQPMARYEVEEEG